MFLCLLHVVVSPLEGVVGPRFEKEVLAFDGHERVERLDASESAAERDREQPPTDGYNSNHDDSRRRQRRRVDAPNSVFDIKKTWAEMLPYVIECLGVILSAWFSFSIAHFGPKVEPQLAWAITASATGVGTSRRRSRPPF